MLSKKLIVIAAAVALALGATTTDADYRVRVHAKHRQHHHKQAPKCGKDESPMSVEGVEGVFCVKGQACVADIDGECPAPQKGLEFGAYCDEVKTGVMGCKPFKSMKEWEDAHGKKESEEVDDDECDADETEVSVEGVEGVFCVHGPVCVADKKGACPEPQDGLEFGAFCDKVKTGVLGCKPYKSMADWAADHGNHHHHHEHGEVDDDECDGDDESPMSVEGVEGVFCVKGKACAGDVDGECPVPQEGLEFGAYCGKVKTGVMGCKPYGSWEEWVKAHPEDGVEESEEVDDDECDDDETEMSVEGVDGIFCVKGNACAANINGTCPEPQEGLEFGAYCDKVKTGVFGCKPKAAPKTAKQLKKKSVHKHKQAPKCGKDESPMSVEGVEGVFCVKGDACVADIDGECPTPQKGLEFGAYCDEVKTGVMGCKPYKSWEDWLKDHPEDNEESEEVDDDECDDDETEMSVEGVEGIFCVAGQACVANTNGTCPEPQDGLEFGAYCGKVKSGVLGCKPYKSEAERKAGPPKTKLHTKFVKGHTKKVVKAHAKKVLKKHHN